VASPAAGPGVAVVIRVIGSSNPSSQHSPAVRPLARVLGEGAAGEPASLTRLVGQWARGTLGR